MNEALEKSEVTWANCIGLGVDNTSVNLGCRNSMKIKVLQQNLAIYVMGCACHILHITAGKAAEAFEAVRIALFA